jgi:hypothetical protein
MFNITKLQLDRQVVMNMIFSFVMIPLPFKVGLLI